MYSYVSFIFIDYSAGTDGNSFSLENKTTFKFVFDESIVSIWQSHMASSVLS